MEIIIKLDHEEPVKVKTSSIYEEMPQFPDMDKIRDKFWAENYIGKLKEKIDMLKMDLQTRDDEIQDLKLENDRLMQQNKLMIDYIHALACVKSKKSKFYALCGNVNCPYYDYDKGFGKGGCKLVSQELIEKEAANIIDKLEDL